MKLEDKGLNKLAPVVRIFIEYRPLLIEFQQHAKVRKPKMIAMKRFNHLRDVAFLLEQPFLHYADPQARQQIHEVCATS